MKKLKKLFILIIVSAVVCALFVSFQPVFAEEETNVKQELADNVFELLSALDLSELESYLDTLTIKEKYIFGNGGVYEKINAVINGDFKVDYKNFISAIGSLIFDGVVDMLPIFAIICSIAILCGVLNMFQSSFLQSGISKIIHLVGYSSVLVLLLTSFIDVSTKTFAAVTAMQKQMQAVFPILLTLIATSGGTVSVAVYQPAVVFLSEIIVDIISNVVLPVTIVLAVVTMVGGFSEDIKLNNFSAVFKSVNKWILGISFTVFSVFLTTQGITSATYDGLSFKAAKYAISNSVPIVGGFLSGGFDLIIAGSILIKNAVGSCGIILLVSVLISPLLELLAFSLFLKLTAAITEPIQETKISGFLASFSGIINYLIAGILVVGFMYFITLLLLICSSNSLF